VQEIDGGMPALRYLQEIRDYVGSLFAGRSTTTSQPKAIRTPILSAAAKRRMAFFLVGLEKRGTKAIICSRGSLRKLARRGWRRQSCQWHLKAHVGSKSNQLPLGNFFFSSTLPIALKARR
jgi:hypothetical protein